MSENPRKAELHALAPFILALQEEREADEAAILAEARGLVAEGD